VRHCEFHLISAPRIIDSKLISLLSFLRLLPSVLLPPAPTSPILSTALASFSMLARGTSFACVEGESGGGKTIRKINLCADEIGEVCNHEDVLDMVIKVTLDVCWLYFGCKGQGIHEILTEDDGRFFFFIEDIGDID